MLGTLSKSDLEAGVAQQPVASLGFQIKAEKHWVPLECITFWKAAADKRQMFGVVPELVEVEGAGSEMGTGSGVGTETGTEDLRILVLSEEDTIDGTRREVTELQTDANEGLGSDGGVSGELVWSRKVTLCLTQSINGLCRVNQSSPSTAGKSWSNLVNKNQICRRVPQGNCTEIWEAWVMVPAKDPSRS